MSVASTDLLVISSGDIATALPMPAAIEVNRDVFAKIATEEAVVPQRVILPVPETNGGATLFKPAYIQGTGLGLKVVSVRPDNAAKGLPTVPGVVCLVDEVTAMPTAIVDGTYLTVLRTAAGSAAATVALAREDSEVEHHLLVFGAGGQGKAHVQALAHARTLHSVSIVNRTPERAAALAQEMKEAFENGTLPAAAKDIPVESCGGDDADKVAEFVKRATLIVTATNSSEPLFDGSLVAAGTHICMIGSYTPTLREVDSGLIARATTFGDNPAEKILAQSGDYSIPLAEGAIEASCIAATLGEVLVGTHGGRSNAEEITIFKSLGNSAQDIATGAAVYRACLDQGLGTKVPFS